MPVPYTFATATTAIPLSQLDSNFGTAITLGNTAIQLGNTVTTLNNMTLANVTISSGTVSITNVAVTTANVSGTANISTLVVVGNSTMGGNVSVGGNVSISVNTSVGGNASVTGNVSAAGGSFSSVTSSGDVTLSGGTANGVLYLNGSKVATSGSALTFDGTNLGVAMPSPASFLGKFGVNGNIALGTGGIQYFWNSSNVYGWSIRNAVNDLTFANYGGSDQMTLTSTGLGIGTPAPSNKLQVYGAANSALANFTGNSGGSTARGLTIGTYVSNGGGDCGVEFNAAINNTGYGGFKFSGGSTNYATIDSSGNLGLGVTPTAQSNYAIFDLKGRESAQSAIISFFTSDGTKTGAIQSDTTYGFLAAAVGARPFTVFTNGTERARIDSSGNLLVGTTSSDLQTTGVKLIRYNSTQGNIALGDSSTSDVDIRYTLYSTGAAQYQFYVGMGGTVYARSTSISGLSDQREKENIRPLESGLNKILALQPRRFDWKNGQGQNVAGFIAQEVQEILPDLVDEYSLNNNEKRMSLKMGDMIPTLVKAIQEQQALIQQLTARVAQLESN